VQESPEFCLKGEVDRDGTLPPKERRQCTEHAQRTCDQEGRQVARYMIAGRRAIDITVHPDQRLTDELILTLALTARWVSSYFDSSGGG
jgi:hypothetical protein